MNGRASAVLLGCALAAAGAAGCDKTATYTYFNIHMVLDRQTVDDELLDLIAACAASADIQDRHDDADLRCLRHRVPNDLGIFQYTTTQTKGEVTFKVIMNSYWGVTLAQGTLDPLGIAPGMTIDQTLTIHAIPGVERMPPGPITPFGDGGADAAVDAPGGGSDAADAAPGAEAGADAGVDAGGNDAADAAGGDSFPDAADAGTTD
jgi:hypothetical protein